MQGRSPDAVAGTYAPTRRVDSSMFRLRQLAQQVTVEASNGVLSIRPAILPFGRPLTKVAPGVFTWSGRDVAFAGSGDDAMMQIGAPPNLFRRVPWWENAGLVVPAVIVSLLASWVAVLAWAIRMRRGRDRERFVAATVPDSGGAVASPRCLDDSVVAGLCRLAARGAVRAVRPAAHRRHLLGSVDGGAAHADRVLAVGRAYARRSQHSRYGARVVPHRDGCDPESLQRVLASRGNDAGVVGAAVRALHGRASSTNIGPFAARS